MRRERVYTFWCPFDNVIPCFLQSVQRHSQRNLSSPRLLGVRFKSPALGIYSIGSWLWNLFTACAYKAFFWVHFEANLKKIRPSTQVVTDIYLLCRYNHSSWLAQPYFVCKITALPWAHCSPLVLVLPTQWDIFSIWLLSVSCSSLLKHNFQMNNFTSS